MVMLGYVWLCWVMYGYAVRNCILSFNNFGDAVVCITSLAQFLETVKLKRRQFDTVT